ncbi:MAG: 3-phosphoshikimate 1-carboxyvinyltransferase [Chloroflexota bacterium]
MAPLTVAPAPPNIQTRLAVPGDKSISHRALLLTSLASGTSTIRNLGPGQDVRSSLGCMRQLGVEIDEKAGVFQVYGEGLDGLLESRPPLDCGNSGTTARLLAGILAGLPFTTVLVGDRSLSQRPMGRVGRPLRMMGADVAGETLPLTIRGGSLWGIEYQPEAASAQVKSCILLAGLRAGSPTTVMEPLPTRDHTERLLRAQGVPVIAAAGRITVQPAEELAALDIDVPGDFSSAAFWLVAGLLLPGASVTVAGVGVNPTRTGLLDVLAEMGADVSRSAEREAGGEPVADLTARGSHLSGVEVDAAIVPRLIDEVPVLAVAAALAEGRTTIRGAAELRLKESDRLAALAVGLAGLGVRVEELPDGLVIEGRPGRFAGGFMESHGDHRLAMAWAIAGLASTGGVTVDDPNCASISYPSFWQELRAFSGTQEAQ